MLPEIPDYYRMSPTQDLHNWVASALRTAQWRTDPQALLLDLLWFNLFRYVRRLPFKGITALDARKDIAKAIACLQALDVALQAPCERKEA